MKKADIDISQIVLRDTDSMGFPEGHVHALHLFRDSVVLPSLSAVDHELEENARSLEPWAAFYEGDLVDLFQVTIEGYVLTVQSMWERGLRDLLINREKRLCGGAEVNAIQKAAWPNGPKSLQSHFERLLDVPLAAFDSYEDLNLLQSLGNAIRHGDGASAERVHQLAPSLWTKGLVPGETYQAGPFTISAAPDAPKHPSFKNVSLNQLVLEQMILSVSGFWLDLERMRCNSFSNKHESVVQQLESWPEERRLRRSKRVWTVESSSV